MKNRIRIFIKTHKVSQGLDAFSCITVNSINGTSSLSLSGFVSADTRHRTILEAIFRYLKNIDPSCNNCIYELVFYTDSNEIAYEWMREYKEEGCLSNSTPDLDLYEKIIKQIRKLGLTVNIVGKDSVLSLMNKVLK